PGAADLANDGVLREHRRHRVRIVRIPGGIRAIVHLECMCSKIAHDANLSTDTPPSPAAHGRHRCADAFGVRRLAAALGWVGGRGSPAVSVAKRLTAGRPLGYRSFMAILTDDTGRAAVQEPEALAWRRRGCQRR